MIDYLSSADEQFKVHIYFTLLSLNNNNYKEKIYLDEISITEDFLRKLNNFKVKIQLKRKEKEIDKLLEEIKKLYEKEKELIDKYNIDNIDIINTILSKDPKSITPLIDKLTKAKMHFVSKLDYYSLIIKTNINYYHLNDNIITINDNIVISKEELYEMYSYLLNINNYKEVFKKEDIKTIHKKIITDLISSIKDNTELNKEERVLVILNYLVKNNIDTFSLDFSKFHIDNIKISDLYNFANSGLFSKGHATWRKVIIPNDYLFNKIKELVSSGMCYYKDNNFILENNSDFKVSINTSELINLITKMDEHI